MSDLEQEIRDTLRVVQDCPEVYGGHPVCDSCTKELDQATTQILKAVEQWGVEQRAFGLEKLIEHCSYKLDGQTVVAVSDINENLAELKKQLEQDND